MEKAFTRGLMRWHRQSNKREMPWKGEKDPYKIWLSEIILQQTRVEQGWQYYLRFIKEFPTVKKLAGASDQRVYKLWEGLGYYTRCKNLLYTARLINNKYQGVFPDQYEELLALKGVGPYTAAAIASFAYNLPYAVVDGNVFRVLSRYFGLDIAIDSTTGKKIFTELANNVLFKKEAGSYNQAIMDFGATVCKPFSPLCSSCPLHTTCTAYQQGLVNQLPVKDKLLLRKNRWFTYFIFEVDQQILVHKRSQKDIWENLYEFYLLESESPIKWDAPKINLWLNQQIGVKRSHIESISPLISQSLTHQEIKGCFIWLQMETRPVFGNNFDWQPLQKIRKLPFPKLITGYLENRPC